MTDGTTTRDLNTDCQINISTFLVYDGAVLRHDSEPQSCRPSLSVVDIRPGLSPAANRNLVWDGEVSLSKDALDLWAGVAQRVAEVVILVQEESLNLPRVQETTSYRFSMKDEVSNVF